jgi:molecular chaperone GrpE
LITMTDDFTPADQTEDMLDGGEAQAVDVEALQTEIAELREKVLRVAADAENAKRRAEREANDGRAFAIQKFAGDLLGVADNLQRAMQHAPRDAEDPLVKNLAIGLEMTEKALLAAFERNGLKRIDPARGEKFDPHQHQAMMEQHADDVGPGVVLQVMQSGYDLFGRNVRPAMVIVSAKGSGGGATSGGGSNPYAQADSDAGAEVDRKA